MVKLLLRCRLRCAIVMLIFVCVQISYVRAKTEDDVVVTSSSHLQESTTLTIEEKWELIEQKTRSFTKDAVKNVMAIVWENEGYGNMSTVCMRQILKIAAGIRDIRPWAYSFLDASGKMLDGTLSGSMSNYGEFDQCLAAQARERRRGNNEGKLLFQGKYCTLEIKPPLPPKKHYYKLNEVIDELKNFSRRDTIIAEAAKSAHMFYMVTMRLGICMPSGCSEQDISQITDSFTEFTGVDVTVKRCEIKEEPKFTPSVISIISVYCFFGLLVLLATIIDTICYYTERKITSLPIRLLLCFSFILNFKKLVHVPDEPGPLNCFSGLRVLSITWIILGHTYLNINLTQFHGLKRVMEFPNDFAFQAVINATVAVDTFFFMGGVLVCYLSVKLVTEMKKPFNVFLYIFHRLFRIYPIYALTMAFLFLAPLIGSGPTWHDTIDSFVVACEKNWWENLLFINNFYHSKEVCLPQSWYVACDFQLYICALLILLPLFKWPKVGLSIASFAVIASMVGTAFLTYTMGHPPTMLYVHPDLDDRINLWSSSYFKPYSHAGPYYLGMLIGYLILTKPKLRFSMPIQILGWTSAFACNMAVLYGVWEWNKGVDPTLLETLIYSGCHRVAWSLGVAWVVVCCATGQGGVVNYILTWKCWTVIGRLTYTAYLIHPIVQITCIAAIRMNLQAWHFFAVWMFFGHLMITYGCSFVASMLIEAPFLSLEKVIFGKQLKEIAGADSKAENLPKTPQDPDDGHSGTMNGYLENRPGPQVNRMRPLTQHQWNNAHMRNGGSLPPMYNGHWRPYNVRSQMDIGHGHMKAPNAVKNKDDSILVYRL